jgi:calcineurin-like phosphoesterase family protein
MSNVFFASDHHFGHANILNFKRDDGVTPLRVFEDVNHMNEYMVMQHNRVVGHNDKVYFLGDVTMARNAEGLKVLGRMNGTKILIKGNHDACKVSQYMEYFKDIRGVYHIDGLVMSHLHHREVLLEGTKVPDKRYFSVCMERLDDYQPIALEEMKRRFK